MNARRRDFLKILGIGTAAGLAGCSTSPPDTLTPYVEAPEGMVRGHALWFRSTCRECPAGCGIEVRVREGRVHKVEGNPKHPVNGGGLCARGQAAVQGLYNPDRLRTPLVRDGGQLKPATWDEAMKRVKAALGDQPATVVTGAERGALADLARRLGDHVQFEPIAYEALREANRLCFGTPAIPVLRFAEARTMVLFGTDAIETFVSPVGYARGITEARRAGGHMVYVGSRMSLTAARADQWIATRPGAEGALAMALLRQVLALGGGKPLTADERAKLAAWSKPYDSAPQTERLARELLAGPSVVVAGGAANCDDNALFTAVAVNLLNCATGAINNTVRFDRSSPLANLTPRSEFAAALAKNGAVIVAGANPAYHGFAAALRKVPFLAVLASWPDETTQLAHVVLPTHTPLESWGDYEPWTGVRSLMQPAMRPLFDTRDTGDILLELANAPQRTMREFVAARWKDDLTAALERGGAWGDVPERNVKLSLAALPQPAPPRTPEFRLETYPSLAHFDGRGANRPWLQEMPDPVVQTVWDSWLEINPDDATRLGISTGDRVHVASKHGALETAAYVYPGIEAGAVAMPLGQGHTAFGRYATGVGANAAALLDPACEQWAGESVEIRLVQKARALAIVPGHNLQERRGIARSRIVPGPVEKRQEHHISMYPEQKYAGHRWAMVVDLDACNGCSACIAACYAENNVPVVGREEVRRGRLMAWIRVERFFGPAAKVEQPFRIDHVLTMCQQCGNAPCEPVCPAYAAVHNAEGLNAQVYNRCVGTRYCSNNCPYKQRRFNWYQAEFPEPLDWQLNPDVTVRTKGVMEKCTFCIQRITAGKDRARREGRALVDGDIVPACAQSCPTQAIVFGDLNDKSSRVARAVENPRRYTILEELNTRPAVTYLERERRI
jgi:anaerobic selenocysteine-containing dehydrogenase/Fe-S-cluster-containing dehydrogenase component